jgi:hypothetical protein
MTSKKVRSLPFPLPTNLNFSGNGIVRCGRDFCVGFCVESGPAKFSAKFAG